MAGIRRRSASSLRATTKDGCFAEYAHFPTENVHAINEQRIANLGVTPAQLCEISGVMSAVGAANAIHVRPGETVLIMPGTGFCSPSAIVGALGLGATRHQGRRHDGRRRTARHYTGWEGR